jgi:hypothetical protein
MKSSKGLSLVLAMISFLVPKEATPEQGASADLSVPLVEIGEVHSSSPEKFVVANEKLRNQKEWPYMFGGKVIDADHPRWNEYAEPIQNFPDVVDCLEEGSSGPRTTDLYRIDWSKLTSHRDVEVCLFRIFDTLSDPVLVRAWLRSMGYRTLPIVKQGISGVGSQIRDQASQFESHISRDVFRNRVSFSKKSRWLHFWVPKRSTLMNYIINIGFTKDGEIYTVLSSSQGR